MSAQRICVNSTTKSKTGPCISQHRRAARKHTQKHIKMTCTPTRSWTSRFTRFACYRKHTARIWPSNFPGRQMRKSFGILLGCMPVVLTHSRKGLWYMFTEQPQVHRKNVVKEYNRIVKGRNTWLDFLAFSKTQIKSVFEQLAREDLGPVLICGNGTGFIVCLLLKLLYVADEDVKREYLLTQRNWEALCEEHNERRRMEGFDDLSAPEFPVKATDQTIEYLDAQYNGIEGYLASIGLMDGEIRRVRANMRGSGGMSQKVLIDVDESSL